VLASFTDGNGSYFCSILGMMGMKLVRLMMGLLLLGLLGMMLLQMLFQLLMGRMIMPCAARNSAGSTDETGDAGAYHYYFYPLAYYEYYIRLLYDLFSFCSWEC